MYTDHQPLELVVKKPLHVAPRRLQRMMIRLQKYDFEEKYMPGKNIVLADILFRASISEALTEMEFWSSNAVHEFVAWKSLLEKVKRATEEDATIQALKQVISEGWPNEKTALPQEVRQYFAVRGELATEDDPLFRADRIVVPKCLQRDLMQRVHGSHLGNNAYLSRIRECVYWPNMSSPLRDFTSTYRSCHRHD